MDHYATLGLSKSATEADIKTAFKKLALLHHPDRGGDTQQFSAINEAYEVLKDPKKKLWNGIREGVIDYFENNHIVWWPGQSSPAGHMLSSQIACLNHLFFL